MAPSTNPAPADIADLIRRGREAMAKRDYAGARDLFDEALRVAPDDPRVQSLAVTAEFWRRLAREGDGFSMPTPSRPLAPTPTPKPKGPS